MEIDTLDAIDEISAKSEDLYFSKELLKIKNKMYILIFFIYLFPQLTSILAFVLKLLNVHIYIIIPIMIIGPLTTLIVAIVAKKKLEKI